MLTHLILENFKAFGRRQEIPLAPITLIFGANSAGKSTILQALLLLKQSVGSEREEVLVTDGEFVDVGSPTHFVYGHRVDVECEISVLVGDRGTGLRFRPHDIVNARGIAGYGMPFYVARTSAPLTTARRRPEDGSDVRREDAAPSAFNESARFDEWDRSNPIWGSHLNDVGVTQALSRIEQLLAELRAAAEVDPWSIVALEEFASFYRQGTPEGLCRVAERLFECVEFQFPTFLNPEFYSPLDGPPDEPISPDEWRLIERAGATSPFLPDIPQQLIDTAQDIRGALSRLWYIGPLRARPAELQQRARRVPISVGADGIHTSSVLAGHPEALSKTNYVLSAMGVGYELRMRPLGGSAGSLPRAHEIQLFDLRTGVRMGPSDVGTGVFQILPVIVQAVTQRGGALLIEQPEVHVHPRMQAELGSVIARIASERGPQFIIETHSEHLILRMQRLVREATLKADDLAVLYVSKDELGSHVQRLRLDDEGHFIDEWPDGFFEERFEEMFPT